MAVHVGMVLAGGASTRMGRPKALLEMPDHKLLAQVQADSLYAAGCERVVVVAGCHWTEINELVSGYEVVNNKLWASGRFSSVYAGLKALASGATAGFAGCLILPVDTVGIRAETLRAMLAIAKHNRSLAVRPTHMGRKGQAIWVAGQVAGKWLMLEPKEEARLDLILEPLALNFPVADAAIMNNVNTPKEWEEVIDLV